MLLAMEGVSGPRQGDPMFHTLQYLKHLHPHHFLFFLFHARIPLTIPPIHPRPLQTPPSVPSLSRSDVGAFPGLVFNKAGFPASCLALARYSVHFRKIVLYQTYNHSSWVCCYDIERLGRKTWMQKDKAQSLKPVFSKTLHLVSIHNNG